MQRLASNNAMHLSLCSCLVHKFRVVQQDVALGTNQSTVCQTGHEGPVWGGLVQPDPPPGGYGERTSQWLGLLEHPHLYKFKRYTKQP